MSNSIGFSIKICVGEPHSGYLSEGGVDFEVCTLFYWRQFIADRHLLESLAPILTLLEEIPLFDWGMGYPLEKVVNSQAELEFLMKQSRLFSEKAIAIIDRTMGSCGI
jgi:hypothetical protein